MHIHVLQSPGVEMAANIVHLVETSNLPNSEQLRRPQRIFVCIYPKALRPLQANKHIQFHHARVNGLQIQASWHKVC